MPSWVMRAEPPSALAWNIFTKIMKVPQKQNTAPTDLSPRVIFPPTLSPPQEAAKVLELALNSAGSPGF